MTPWKYAPLAAPEEDAVFRDIVLPSLTIPLTFWEPLLENVGRENLRTLKRDGRIVGGGGIFRMGQWFGGRIVPCGGITLVGMSPDCRKQGAAKFLMQSLLEELQADGTPLACLYASTQRLYRRVGFEQAGSKCLYELPLTSIGAEDRELPVTPISSDSPEPFISVAETRARMTNGNLQRTPGLWRRLLTHPDHPVQRYLIGEPDRPEGYILYNQQGEHESPTIFVKDMAALTPAAGRRLWTFLADHQSVVQSVRWNGPVSDPLLCLAAECKFVPMKLLRWMTRIVDVKGALEGRGYAPGVEGELHLDVRDELLPSNSGRFVLTVSEGAGQVHEGGAGQVRTDIRGLAALFTGFLPAQTLKSVGWIEGDEPAQQAATRLFAGPEPWMPEIF